MWILTYALYDAMEYDRDEALIIETFKTRESAILHYMAFIVARISNGGYESLFEDKNLIETCERLNFACYKEDDETYLEEDEFCANLRTLHNAIASEQATELQKATYNSLSTVLITSFIANHKDMVCEYDLKAA